MKDSDAPETGVVSARNRLAPTLHRRIKAMVEVAAGLIIKLRTIGKTCSKAARRIA